MVVLRRLCPGSAPLWPGFWTSYPGLDFSKPLFYGHWAGLAGLDGFFLLKNFLRRWRRRVGGCGGIVYIFLPNFLKYMDIPDSPAQRLIYKGF